MPHWGLEPASVLCLAFQSDAVATRPPLRSVSSSSSSCRGGSGKAGVGGGGGSRSIVVAEAVCKLVG